MPVEGHLFTDIFILYCKLLFASNVKQLGQRPQASNYDTLHMRAGATTEHAEVMSSVLFGGL